MNTYRVVGQNKIRSFDDAVGVVWRDGMSPAFDASLGVVEPAIRRRF